jgi:hypothetical protein
VILLRHRSAATEGMVARKLPRSGPGWRGPVVERDVRLL